MCIQVYSACTGKTTHLIIEITCTVKQAGWYLVSKSGLHVHLGTFLRS